MRYLLMPVPVLMLPASAAAHGGPHEIMNMYAWIMHLAGQHAVPGLAAALMVALLLPGYPALRRRWRSCNLREAVRGHPDRHAAPAVHHQA